MKIKMVVKMATACLFALVDTLTYVFYHPISSKLHNYMDCFHQMLARVKIWVSSDEQLLSPVDLLLWTLYVIYHPISNFIHALLKSISIRVWVLSDEYLTKLAIPCSFALVVTKQSSVCIIALFHCRALCEYAGPYISESRSVCLF